MVDLFWRAALNKLRFLYDQLASVLHRKLRIIIDDLNGVFGLDALGLHKVEQTLKVGHLNGQ